MMQRKCTPRLSPGYLIRANANDMAPWLLGSGGWQNIPLIWPLALSGTIFHEGGINMLQWSAVGNQLMLAKGGKRRVGNSTLHRSSLRFLFPWAQTLQGRWSEIVTGLHPQYILLWALLYLCLHLCFFLSTINFATWRKCDFSFSPCFSGYVRQILFEHYFLSPSSP